MPGVSGEYSADGYKDEYLTEEPKDDICDASTLKLHAFANFASTLSIKCKCNIKNYAENILPSIIIA